MSHPVYRYSSIARPLDPNYATNVAVMILAPLGGIAVAVWLYTTSVMTIGGAAIIALEAAFIAFLAWALGRELDPDINQSAFVGMALALVAIALGFNPSILNLAAVLFAARIVNRTVGNPLTRIDLVVLSVLGIGLALLGAPWWTCFLIAAALTLDTVFDRARGENLYAAVAVFIAGLYALAMNGAPQIGFVPYIERGWLVAVAVVGGLFLIMVATTPAPVSPCDARPEIRVEKRRLQAAMLLALAGGLASLLLGPADFHQTLPVWAALAGVIEGRAMPKRPGRKADG